jgi:CDP-4-dehydro-6-deoxyglucose reductase
MSFKVTSAQVDNIIPLTDSILQVTLVPDQFIDYIAGQYLQIHCAHDAFSYSIANAPLGSRKYELHIRHSQDNPISKILLAEIKQSGKVSLSLPLGNCHLQNLDSRKPILFIAGGTGFAPIKAMIEQLLADGDERSFELFWGARSQSDLYLDEMVNHWQKHVVRFQYFSLLSNLRKENLSSLVLGRHSQDLHDWQIVIGGPFDMVYSTRDILVEHGQVLRENIFSDAFSFESS